MISAAEVIREDVTFASDGFTINGYLARPGSGEGRAGARPDAKGQCPAVVIIHEWWGVTDHMKDLALRFAREGYAALVPNLYSRLGYGVTKDAAEAAKWMESLASQKALRDLNAATNFLNQQPFIDHQRMGAVGFCMGGTFALIMATNNSDIKATVVFYGKVPPIETCGYLVSPVLYHYGAKDGWVTRQEVDRLKEGLAKYGKPGEVHVYPEAGHAFFNDARLDAYRAEDAKRAWERTLQFFRQHLR